MKNVAMVWALLLATNSIAEPVAIDLSVERAEYEAKARPRNIGLTLLGAALISYGGVGAGFGYAANARALLLDQRLPIDLVQRQSLISGGQTANGLGVAAALLGIGLTIGAIYFLAVSF